MRLRDMEKLAAQVRQVIAELYDSHARRPLRRNATSEGEPKAIVNI